MNKSLYPIFFVALLCLPLLGASQSIDITQLSLSTEAQKSTYPEQAIRYQGESYLYLPAEATQQSFELTVRLANMARWSRLQLQGRAGVNPQDSLVKFGREYFRGTVRLSNLADRPNPRLVFVATDTTGTTENVELKVYSFFKPQFPKVWEPVELFLGEQKEITLPIGQASQLVLDGQWHRSGRLEYRLFRTSSQQAALEVKATSTGTYTLELDLKTDRPYLDENGLPTTQLPTQTLEFQVKPSQISYLNADREAYFFEPGGATAIAIQLEYHPGLQLGKTYRIENQEAPGGRLVAEIYTRQYVDNRDKVLASLRTYAMHSRTEGYLYVKDGDRTRFFTNFDILAKPHITRVSLLHPGKDWTTNLGVNPGDTVEVKVEGQGLQKADFLFGDGKYRAQADTSRTSQEARYYILPIPTDINETKVPLSMNGQATSFELLVREEKRPHPLNFVRINYGARTRPITMDTYNKPVLYGSEILDVNLLFDAGAIDTNTEFYGPQYLEVEIEVLDEENKLIEIKHIRDIVVVPDYTSPRHAYYDRQKASAEIVSLNDYLGNKTYDLKPWSRIILRIKHREDRYGGNAGYSRDVEIIRSQRTMVELEVSFPAGLLVYPFNSDTNIRNLSGISTAALAQMQFYKPGQVAKPYPWSLGVGFIALNSLSTFAADDEDNKDVGLVILGQFKTINRDSKINFPLYAGFGYLFQNETMFMMIGPGIRVNL